MAASPASAAPAALYVRMSRDHQKYSIAHQTSALAAYAARMGYAVVRTYADEGVSGLSIDGREALKQLLVDVLAGGFEPEVILVYDVSRWGRFQDPDESAHYEFLCKSAGVRVEYCAEVFPNDDSLAATVMKHMKRAMAAEYSRDLAAKISHSKANMARLGFWPAGPRPYGFHRMAVGPDGAELGVMREGERCPVHGGRTRLVLGPPAEVEAIRRMFSLYAVHGLSMSSIARLFNSEGAPHPSGYPWTPHRVGRYLRDERYTGVLIFARLAAPFGRARRRPTRDWIRAPGACPTLVSRKMYDLAQQQLIVRRPAGSDEDLLEELRQCWARHGRVSGDILAADPQAHCPSVYVNRFGGLLAALERAGLQPSHKQYASSLRLRRSLTLQKMRPDDGALLAGLAGLLAQEGRLSARLIDACPDLEPSGVYRRRFGCLIAAYRQVGYQPTPTQIRQREIRLNLPASKPAPSWLKLVDSSRAP